MHGRLSEIERIDDGEKKLAEIYKHPIYIVLLYLQVLVGMIAAIGLAYFLLPTVLGDVDSGIMIANGFAALVVFASLFIVLVATYIFRQNRLTITDRNITQVLQSGLFNRKVSQLNIHNVEDVTALQNGVLQTIFNFGSLNIETAGEQVNFHYTYCPNPGYYAKIILDEREKMLGQMSDEEEHAHDKRTSSKTKASTVRTRTSIQATTSDDTALRTSADDSPELLKGIGAEMLRQATNKDNIDK